MTTTPNTKTGLIAFLEMAVNKGMVNANTGGAWRAAVNKVLDDLGDDELVDGYDVHAAVLRYNNRFPGDLTGESLKKYEQRAKTAIDQFVQWKADPMNYKPPSRGLPGEKKSALTTRTRRVFNDSPPVSPTAPAHSDAAQTNGQQHGTPALPTPTNSLTIPIPIRGGKVVVQIVIPVDFTADEAKRVSAVVQALGHHIVDSAA